nr:hypothetical protein [Oscillospiraceae bacterium]
MKKYQKILASLLAVAVSAGATGAFAYRHRDAAAVTHTETAEETQPAEETTEAASEERKPAAGKPFKDETVYVLCNNSAGVRDVIVSDWLKNPGALPGLTDVSSLTNIENVKGDESFTGQGTSLRWDAAGNDIYYKGKSDGELPVTVNVEYILDGQTVSPDALKGKSGHLRIEWHYTNNTAVAQRVGGSSRNICVPFLTASTALLDTNVFRNVSVTNGRVISDGERLIVIGMAFPGLSESLGLDETDLDIEIPETFSIEADVENFTMSDSV